MDAVDAVIGTPGAVPAQVESMLFQRCSGRLQTAGASPIAVRMSVACPKLGVQLNVGEEWMALTPRVPLSPFHTLEAAVRDVSVSLHPSGAPIFAALTVCVRQLPAQFAHAFPILLHRGFGSLESCMMSH